MDRLLTSPSGPPRRMAELDLLRCLAILMVVTLHACDLATDYALEKAVNWGARVILSVPCCQHELNGQMENSLLRPVLQYGLIKERMAALYTDAIRAQVLEYRGYRTQILEFIDMEHTPKNILIRAVRQGRKRDNGLQIRELADFLHVKPTVVELLAPDWAAVAFRAQLDAVGANYGEKQKD